MCPDRRDVAAQNVQKQIVAALNDCLLEDDELDGDAAFDDPFPTA